MDPPESEKVRRAPGAQRESENVNEDGAAEPLGGDIDDSGSAIPIAPFLDVGVCVVIVEPEWPRILILELVFETW